ncbi:hypothetical protein [Pseudobutyrivibrio sp.]
MAKNILICDDAAFMRMMIKSEPSGLRKTRPDNNSLAHRTTWLRSDLTIYLRR